MSNAQPKIYEAIHNILTSMVVEKNGTLPGNMGGKSYATAEAVTNATKNLFVENNLILIPNEEVADIATPDFGDKKTRFLITITGEYTALHIEDGSSIKFSGTGQGLATGTAVAANIASTFAIKNALQRLFLISEDSVESAAHVEQAQPKQTPAIKTAQKSAKVEKAMPPVVEEIKKLMEDKGITSEQMLALNDKIAKEREKNRGEVLPELLERLKAGEQA